MAHSVSAHIMGSHFV